ncbi:MAG: SAM-dependent methyltransferase, partial [uncultured Lysobacter sp.]
AAAFPGPARDLHRLQPRAAGGRARQPRQQALAAGPLHAAAGGRERPAVRATQFRCGVPVLGARACALPRARAQRSATRAVARLGGVRDRSHERLVPARSVFAERVALLDGVQRFPDRFRRRSVRRREARQPAAGRRLPRGQHRDQDVPLRQPRARAAQDDDRVLGGAPSVGSRPAGVSRQGHRGDRRGHAPRDAPGAERSERRVLLFVRAGARGRLL